MFGGLDYLGVASTTDIAIYKIIDRKKNNDDDDGYHNG